MLWITAFFAAAATTTKSSQVAHAFTFSSSSSSSTKHNKQPERHHRHRHKHKGHLGKDFSSLWRTTRLQVSATDTGSISSSSSSSSSTDHTSFATTQLSLQDPELARLIQAEDDRQRSGLELIASENFCSLAVREALGSCLTNKYSEGQVGARYYGGNEFIDQVEQLCMDRALALFGLNKNSNDDNDSEDKVTWGVNVQPYSGSPANFAVYTALLQPHDRIMGLDLPSGGHLTHGFATPTRKVSATSVYFESMPYVVSQECGGLIDYDDLEYRAAMFRPKLLIAGASAYPREWDYRRMRQIADKVGAYLMVDMAHISGLVAAGVAQSPFEHAHVVTTTTHKSLRGPRSGMIFARTNNNNNNEPNLMTAINQAVFPALQGGPHNHQIAALATALLEAQSAEFVRYSQQVVANAQALAAALQQHGHVLATGGTDNHLVLWDVRPLQLTGSKVEYVLERAHMTTNKNSLAGDRSALHPGGIRLGTPALTTRGMTETDMERVAELLTTGCDLAQQVDKEAQVKKNKMNLDGSPARKVLLREFKEELASSTVFQRQLEELGKEVQAFAMQFAMPGDEVANGR